MLASNAHILNSSQLSQPVACRVSSHPEAWLGVQVRTAGVDVIRKTFYKEPTLAALQKQVRSVECSEPNGDLSTLDANVNLVRILSPPITVD